jgi:large subunit ribosomal protein L17
MRHLVKGRKLGRTASHRKATLTALAIALIEEHRITTTVAKAKELRRFIEPLITKAKVDTTHNRRQVFSKLQDKYAVTDLFEEIGPLAKDRPGGYTRVLKLGFRQGDGAELAMIELVDYNDNPPEVLEGKKKRTRRAGRSKKETPAAAKPEARKEGAQPEAEKPEKTAAEQQVADEPAIEAKSDAEVKPEAEEAKAGKEAQAEEETRAKSEKEEAKAEAKDKSEAKAETKADEKAEAKAEAKGETSADFTVAEVKEKIKSMSVEEARAFIGDDDRVTAQRALQKKIDDASSGEEDKK